MPKQFQSVFTQTQEISGISIKERDKRWLDKAEAIKKEREEDSLLSPALRELREEWDKETEQISDSTAGVNTRDQLPSKQINYKTKQQQDTASIHAGIDTAASNGGLGSISHGRIANIHQQDEAIVAHEWGYQVFETDDSDNKNYTSHWRDPSNLDNAQRTGMDNSLLDNICELVESNTEYQDNLLSLIADATGLNPHQLPSTYEVLDALYSLDYSMLSDIALIIIGNQLGSDVSMEFIYSEIRSVVEEAILSKQQSQDISEIRDIINQIVFDENKDVSDYFIYRFNEITQGLFPSTLSVRIILNYITFIESRIPGIEERLLKKLILGKGEGLTDEDINHIKFEIHDLWSTEDINLTYNFDSDKTGNPEVYKEWYKAVSHLGANHLNRIRGKGQTPNSSRRPVMQIKFDEVTGLAGIEMSWKSKVVDRTYLSPQMLEDAYGLTISRSNGLYMINYTGLETGMRICTEDEFINILNLISINDHSDHFANRSILIFDGDKFDFKLEEHGSEVRTDEIKLSGPESKIPFVNRLSNTVEGRSVSIILLLRRIAEGASFDLKFYDDSGFEEIEIETGSGRYDYILPSELKRYLGIKLTIEKGIVRVVCKSKVYNIGRVGQEANQNFMYALSNFFEVDQFGYQRKSKISKKKGNKSIA